MGRNLFESEPSVGQGTSISSNSQGTDCRRYRSCTCEPQYGGQAPCILTCTTQIECFRRSSLSLPAPASGYNFNVAPSPKSGGGSQAPMIVVCVCVFIGVLVVFIVGHATQACERFKQSVQRQLGSGDGPSQVTPSDGLSAEASEQQSAKLEEKVDELPSVVVTTKLLTQLALIGRKVSSKMSGIPRDTYLQPLNLSSWEHVDVMVGEPGSVIGTDVQVLEATTQTVEARTVDSDFNKEQDETQVAIGNRSMDMKPSRSLKDIAGEIRGLSEGSGCWYSVPLDMITSCKHGECDQAQCSDVLATEDVESNQSNPKDVQSQAYQSRYIEDQEQLDHSLSYAKIGSVKVVEQANKHNRSEDILAKADVHIGSRVTAEARSRHACSVKCDSQFGASCSERMLNGDAGSSSVQSLQKTAPATVTERMSDANEGPGDARTQSGLRLADVAHHWEKLAETRQVPVSTHLHSASSNLPAWLEEACVICLDEWEEGARVTILPCKHRVHRDCAVQWAKWQKADNKTCPTCKQPMFTES